MAPIRITRCSVLHRSLGLAQFTRLSKPWEQRHGFVVGYRRHGLFIWRCTSTESMSEPLSNPAVDPAPSASEAESAKQAAVERYFRAMPMSKMMEGMYSEIAKQLPPERRSTFLIEIRKVVPAERLEKIATAAMLKTYSTEEINALADFYSSPYGASAMAKFGAYMSEIMPPTTIEIQRAHQILQTRGW